MAKDDIQEALTRVSVEAATKYVQWCQQVAKLMNVDINLIVSDRAFLKAWDDGMTPSDAVSYIIGH